MSAEADRSEGLAFVLCWAPVNAGDAAGVV